MEKLTRWLDFGPLQYLGRISYSLYLSHLLVAVYVLRFGYRLTGSNHAAAVVCSISAGAVCIGLAPVLYVLVERPSVRFAARFKLGRDEEAVTPELGVKAGFTDRFTSEFYGGARNGLRNRGTVKKLVDLLGKEILKRFRSYLTE